MIIRNPSDHATPTAAPCQDYRSNLCIGPGDLKPGRDRALIPLLTLSDLPELQRQIVADVSARYAGRHLRRYWIERLALEAEWDGVSPALAVAVDDDEWLMSGQPAVQLARLIANAGARTIIPPREIDLRIEMGWRQFPVRLRPSKRRESLAGRGYVARLARPVDVLAQHDLGGILGGLNPFRRRDDRYVVPQSRDNLDLGNVRAGSIQ